MVKQAMVTININILAISELKWIRMGEFNSDCHYIYYCGQESHRRNGVILIINKRVHNTVFGCNLKNDRMILVHFQGKPFNITVVVIQLLSRVQPFATPWTAAHQAFLSFTISQSLLKLMSIESVMSSNHLILCHPILLLLSIFPSIRVFSNEFQLFTSGVQSIGASASASVLPMNIQG